MSQGLATLVSGVPEGGAPLAKAARLTPLASEVERRHAIYWRLGFLFVVLMAWEILARVGVIDARFASQPTSIVVAAGSFVTDVRALTAVGETLGAFAAAFTIGTSAGLLVGVVFGLNRLARDAFFPIIMLLMVVPKSVFLPLIVLFFGLGATAGVAFGALLAFVHVTVNVVAGVDMVEQKYRDVGRAYSATPWRLFLDVIVPGAAPGIFAGLWHGIRNGFIGVVIAQLFVSTVGIGFLVRLYSNNFQIDKAMALTFIMAALVIGTGTVWARLESRLTRWRE
jgi:ABC-type nitrate/sulfonate/bicarbonate transport system permease component